VCTWPGGEDEVCGHEGLVPQTVHKRATLDHKHLDIHRDKWRVSGRVLNLDTQARFSLSAHVLGQAQCLGSSACTCFYFNFSFTWFSSLLKTPRWVDPRIA
jgi:hypothetical protein